jgi:hypothetical protein
VQELFPDVASEMEAYHTQQVELARSGKMASSK